MSGKYWGTHFTEKLLKCDFQRIPGWECLFYHRRLKLILSVYVDDFKLVGKKTSMQDGWDLITNSGIVLDHRRRSVTTLAAVSSPCTSLLPRLNAVSSTSALCLPTWKVNPL